MNLPQQPLHCYSYYHKGSPLRKAVNAGLDITVVYVVGHQLLLNGDSIS